MTSTKSMAERRPSLSGWAEIDAPRSGGSVLSVSAWRRTSSGVVVISALELAELPDRSGTGPQWHISVSRLGDRPRPVDVRAALRAFGLVGAEEDNHHPGVARHFWLPVDPAHRVDCECKEDEQLITESDGYRWTNPHEGECRGCELQRALGRPCPVHAQNEVSR